MVLGGNTGAVITRSTRACHEAISRSRSQARICSLVCSFWVMTSMKAGYGSFLRSNAVAM